VGAVPLVVAVDDLPLVGDDVEAVVRKMRRGQPVGAAQYDPEPQLAGERRDRTVPLVDGRPVDPVSVGVLLLGVARQAAFRELDQAGAGLGRLSIAGAPPEKISVERVGSAPPRSWKG